MTSMKFSLMREIADEADARLAAQEFHALVLGPDDDGRPFATVRSWANISGVCRTGTFPARDGYSGGDSGGGESSQEQSRACVNKTPAGKRKSKARVPGSMEEVKSGPIPADKGYSKRRKNKDDCC
mmetsp:Transcript_6230/g.18427  ORF Transcript_6230/g.18427 Transcript_6230/m.18427 type:complete len:126 (-) Transcript_6230:306-683(-)